jgi:hypothetical protein
MQEFEHEMTVGSMRPKTFFPITPERLEEQRQGSERAKLELTGNILKMRQEAKEPVDGAIFNQLMDMPLHQLHSESIRTQDELYKFKH